MKFLILFLFTLAIAGTSARADENAAARCPIVTGVIRDGGSKFMRIPAYGKQPDIEIICDGRINTTTPNEYYLARDFYQDAGHPLKVKDVLRAFEQAESALLSKYGMEFIYRVAMNPLVLGDNVTADEYVKKFSDTEFIERIDVSEVLRWIQLYRAQHKTEQAGADQPVTKPADKPPVKNQPSTPMPKDAPR